MNEIDLSLEIFPNDIKIYQSEKLYKFTKDAIDLAKFVRTKKYDHVLDMCAGVGVVGLYAYALSSFEKLYFVEIQKDMCEIIQKNIELNNLTNKAKCLNSDLRTLNSTDFDKKLDTIICNPPYFKVGSSSKISRNLRLDEVVDKNIVGVEDLTKLGLDKSEISNICARHEMFATFEDITSKAKELLRPKGKFYTMGIPSRLCEMIITLNKYGFECKRLQINKNENKEVNLELIEAVLNGQSGVEISVK